MLSNFAKAQITILIIAFLCGCSPAASQVVDEPLVYPNTSIPGMGMISSSTVEHLVLMHTFSGHSGIVLDVAFSAGGEFIVSSGQDLNIKFWDVKSRQELQSFRMVSVDMSDIDINTARNLLASGEAIWDLESMQEILTLERGVRYPAFVAFSPDGSELALGLFDKQIDLWDVTSGQLIYSLPKQGNNRTKRMDFSPDGMLLAIGVNDGTVRLWDIESRQYIKTLINPGETDIHDLAFSPDGNYLASGGRMPAVILWNVASGEIVKRFRLTDNLISLAFSPDGTLLASTGGYEHVVHIWSVTSGNLLHSLPHDGQLMSVAFSPDGRFLAAGSFNSQVYLWGIPLEP